MPEWLRERWQGFDTGLHAPVALHRAYWGWSNERLSGFDGSGVMPHGWAEYGGGRGYGEAAFWDPGFFAQLLWAVGVALPAVGLCAVWLLLSRIVGASRHGEAFTTGNAVRLRAVALIAGVTPYLGVLLEQVSTRIALSGSTLAGKASVRLPWSSLPVWPVGVAASAFALATVWRVGVQMRDDVDGLV